MLFIHGSTLPSATSAALRLDGVSWMDDLAARGFDVWALDFLGYGGSDRYPEMDAPPTAHAPLGRVPELERQIDAAVELILRRRGATRVSLIAHSAGTMAAGAYAGHHPERIERLVLYGPIAQEQGPRDTATVPAYSYVTARQQIDRFTGWVPPGQRRVLAERHLAVLAPAYVATDPTSGERTPPSVRAPAGMEADGDAASSGALPYDPASITAPVLILRGEWDVVTTDADARWLFDALRSAALKRDVKIARATHLMHLEDARFEVYDETAAFLAGADRAAAHAGSTAPASIAAPRVVGAAASGAPRRARR